MSRTLRGLVQTAGVAITMSLSAVTAGLAYSPREVTINVGFGAGGVYHTMAMLLSRHLGSKLPSKPNIIVRVMPGAGSLVAANHLANVAPRDGSVLGVIGGGTILEPLFRNPEAKFDPAAFNWIGSTSTETYVCVSWRDAGATTLQHAIDRSLASGSTGRGSRTYTYAAALNQLLGTQFKIITGYRGMTDIHLAIERNELQAVCGWSYSSIPSQQPGWLKENKISILAQFARKKHPDLAEVPLIMDLLKNERDRAAMSLLVVDSLVAWPLVAPPGVPEEAVNILRRSYDAALSDPALLSEAKKLQLVIEPVRGEDIQATVKDVSSLPEDIVEHARRLSGL